MSVMSTNRIIRTSSEYDAATTGVSKNYIFVVYYRYSNMHVEYLIKSKQDYFWITACNCNVFSVCKCQGLFWYMKYDLSEKISRFNNLCFLFGVSIWDLGTSCNVCSVATTYPMPYGVIPECISNNCQNDDNFYQSFLSCVAAS